LWDEKKNERKATKESDKLREEARKKDEGGNLKGHIGR
jgi:hypothetical protein